jgi:hypothetical protein
MTAEPAEDGAVLFTMDFGDSDPWAYPFLNLTAEEHPAADCQGISLTVQLIEGEGTLRCQFGEESGAMYLAELNAQTGNREPQRLTALFGSATWGSYSKPDPNRSLDPDQIRRLLVGINAKPNTRVRLLVRDIRWIKF